MSEPDNSSQAQLTARYYTATIRELCIAASRVEILHRARELERADLMLVLAHAAALRYQLNVEPETVWEWLPDGAERELEDATDLLCRLFEDRSGHAPTPYK